VVFSWVYRALERITIPSLVEVDRTGCSIALFPLLLHIAPADGRWRGARHIASQQARRRHPGTPSPFRFVSLSCAGRNDMSFSTLPMIGGGLGPARLELGGEGDGGLE
jgi:hypothetical protein